MLINKSILGFKKLYLDMYGIDLTEEEARKIAGNIIAMYRTIFGSPLTANNIEQTHDN